jgi:hypothetical protein
MSEPRMCVDGDGCECSCHEEPWAHNNRPCDGCADGIAFFGNLMERIESFTPAVPPPAEQGEAEERTLATAEEWRETAFELSDEVKRLNALLDATRTPQPAGEEEHDCHYRQRKDDAYYERNRVVAAFARLALTAGYRAGTARTAIEGWSEDWHGCVYIEGPWGQASWHFRDSQAHLFAGLPPYDNPYDGHTTEEKYERLNVFAQSSPASDARAEAQWEATRWFRVLDATGHLYAETSNEREAREAGRRINRPVERLWKRTENEWRIAAAREKED